MSYLTVIFMFCKSILDIEFTYAGFTFTLWEVFIATIFFCIIGYVIGRILNIWGN